MQKAELQKPFEWIWNILDYFQSLIAKTYDPKIDKAHPWLIRSRCMKFHDPR